MIDLANPQAGYWGIGDEPFDLTTVDDRPVPRRSYGSLEQPKQTLEAEGDPWAHVMEWYSLALFTTPPFDHTDNDRYPAFRPASLDDYLDSMLAG